MKIDMYCSVNNKMKFLSVPAGTDVSKMQFPADFDPDLRVLRFKSQLEFIPGEHYIAVDAQDVVNQINVSVLVTPSSQVFAVMSELGRCKTYHLSENIQLPRSGRKSLNPTNRVN
jgi:hypothetical protein